MHEFIPSGITVKNCLSTDYGYGYGFQKVLQDEGVEEINPLGQPFDANEAEAIMAVQAQEGEEVGIVKQVYVKGYKKGDKVLRYAQVIVTRE